MEKFSDDEQREIPGSRDAWGRWMNGTSAIKIWNAARPKYPVEPVKDALGYNSSMTARKKDLAKFLEEVKTNNIKRNDVHIAYFSDNVIAKLKEENVFINSNEIHLSVSKYRHIVRDVKIRLGKAAPDEVILDMYRILHSRSVIKYDQKKKNILYFSNLEKDKWVKIVVQPNYKTGKTVKNYILTAGLVKEANLNDKFYEDIL